MVYVDNNEKLASLLEKLLDKDRNHSTIADAKDLIFELRSPRGDVTVLNKDSLTRRDRKTLSLKDNKNCWNF